MTNRGAPGHGVDAQGGPVIDPTKNVTALVKADSKHTREIISLHASYQRELREKEAERINAIRTVDVNAVAAARADAEARASALAVTVTNQAETVRVALAAALTPIQTDIADLRKTQYEGVGGNAKVGSIGVWLGIAGAIVFGLLSTLISAAGLVYGVTR